MNSREERHSAASAIIKAEEPFVLLLRTYAKRMPWNRNLQNEVFDSLSTANVGVISVRGDHPLADQEEADDDPQMKARCPALSIAASDWRTVVGNLVERATFLICEVWSDTPGITDELSMCRSAKRTDDTVVLLPRPGLEDLRCYETFEGFWRLVLYGDLKTDSLFSHPSTRSLARLEASGILSSASKERGAPWSVDPSRDGIPIIIPELVEMALGYIDDKDWGSGSVHAQNAWNIAVRLAERNAPFSLAEREAVVRAGMCLAIRLVQFDRITDAVAKLDVALLFASEPELRRYAPKIEQLRQLLTAQESGTRARVP